MSTPNNKTVPYPMRQLGLFTFIVGLSFGVQYLQSRVLEKPSTLSAAVKDEERKKFLFQGDKRDPLFFNYAKNSAGVHWPKWDRRDDPEDNIYEEFVKSKNE